MTGITNKPESEENARQAITQQNKENLLPEDQAGPKDHLDGKDQSDKPQERGRVAETGAGRGTELLNK